MDTAKVCCSGRLYFHLLLQKPAPVLQDAGFVPLFLQNNMSHPEIWDDSCLLVVNVGGGLFFFQISDTL
jgi:hypothetical protein